MIQCHSQCPIYTISSERAALLLLCICSLSTALCNLVTLSLCWVTVNYFVKFKWRCTESWLLESYDVEQNANNFSSGEQGYEIQHYHLKQIASLFSYLCPCTHDLFWLWSVVEKRNSFAIIWISVMPTEREESLWDKPVSSHCLITKIEVMVKLSGNRWIDGVAQGHRNEIR